MGTQFQLSTCCAHGAGHLLSLPTLLSSRSFSTTTTTKSSLSFSFGPAKNSAVRSVVFVGEKRRKRRYGAVLASSSSDVGASWDEWKPQKAASDSSSSTGKLLGKVAIVTGGASGIGEATARSFSRHGARAVVIADVQDERGRAVAASIVGGAYFRCDVTDEDQVRALVEFVAAEYGSLDVMFANAGVGSAGEQTVLDLDLAAMDGLYAVNARGAAACVKHAARVMVEKGIKGSVVCTASKAGSAGGFLYTDYRMSKHAVLGLVRSASLQLGRHGIRVNTVSPGVIRTPLVLSRIGSDPEELRKGIAENASLKMDGGRVPEVEDVAEAVAFLASDEARVITGHDLAVDGGVFHIPLPK